MSLMYYLPKLIKCINYVRRMKDSIQSFVIETKLRNFFLINAMINKVLESMIDNKVPATYDK